MNTRPSVYRMRPVFAIVLLALVACMTWVTPAAAADDWQMGTGTLKIKFEQWPVVNSLNSASLDPNKCLVNIPFRGVFSSTVPQGVSYRAVHSDGTKSSRCLCRILLEPAQISLTNGPRLSSRTSRTVGG